MKVLLLVLLGITAIYASDLKWQWCANQGGNCKCTTYTSYGVGSRWYTTPAIGNSQPCENHTWRRDPAPGERKTCWCLEPRPVYYGTFKKVQCGGGGYIEGTHLRTCTEWAYSLNLPRYSQYRCRRKFLQLHKYCQTYDDLTLFSSLG